MTDKTAINVRLPESLIEDIEVFVAKNKKEFKHRNIFIEKSIEDKLRNEKGD